MDESVPFLEQRLAFYHHDEWARQQNRGSLYVGHSPLPTEFRIRTGYCCGNRELVAMAIYNPYGHMEHCSTKWFNTMQ